MRPLKTRAIWLISTLAAALAAATLSAPVAPVAATSPSGGPQVARTPTTLPTTTAAKAATKSAVAGRLSLMPGIAQRGRTAAAPVSGTQALAVFPRARTGQATTLQAKADGGWQSVATARLDRVKSAVFTLPHSTGTFRAVVTGTAAVTNTVQGRDFEMVFSDTFSGNRLDTSKWSDTKTIAPAHMRMCSRNSPHARSVAGGVVHLGVAPDRDKAGQTCRWRLNGRSGSHPYMWNTQLNTDGKFDFTYGYAAARMRMHRDKGMHASFWSQPTNWYTAGRPALGTEIDVVEFFGRTNDGTGTIASFVHWLDANGNMNKRGDKAPRANLLLPAGDNWWNAYHVFSVERTPEAIIFRVDGREFRRETEVVSRAPQYLLLSMLTSDYEMERLTRAGMRQTAAVDWVRVWKG